MRFWPQLSIVSSVEPKIQTSDKVWRPQIKSGELAVYVLDECHLLGDDVVGYLWADKKDRGWIHIPNQRERQTYYGALNLLTNEFIVSPYDGGNGKNTVQFLEEIKKHHPPHQKNLLVWDGVSYHRGEEMKEFLRRSF